MDSSRIFFDPNTSCHGGNMLFLGNSDSVFRGSRSFMNMEENSKRNRPFFSSPEELYDDEYYDEQLPEKKRRLTPEQVHLLEKSFEAENKLETERKTQLAKILGLQPRQVAIWFQNRRARWKTKQLERDYDLLKSNYDSLLANYESMLKDNDKLKSEVVSLAEKFQDKEEAAGEPIPANKSELLHGNQMSDVGGLQYRMKVEDRLSTGSGGSAVMDEEGPQLVGSCDYYFPTDQFPAVWVDPLDHTVHTEEDDGSEDGQSYFSNVFGVVEQQQQEDGAPLSWWVWS